MVILLLQLGQEQEHGSALESGLMPARLRTSVHWTLPLNKNIGVFVMIIDQVSDKSGVKLHGFTKLYNVPEFVKSASSGDITGNGTDLPSSVYGDPRTLKFPCHTPSSTYVSLAYFLDQEESFGKIASSIKERILKAGDYFGIRPSLDGLITKHASMQKHSEDNLPDDDFAIVVKFETGRKTRSYPIRNEQEVKAAAEWMGKYANDLNFKDRKTIAGKILVKAAEYGVSLANESEITKFAADGLVSKVKVANMLFDRAKALKVLKKDPEIQEMLAKTAQHVLNNSAPDIMDKAASIISSVDEQYKFKSLGSVNDLYTLSVKTASKLASAHIQLTNGSVYKKAELESIKLDEIKDLFGNEFADRVSSGGLFVDSEKLAEELATLPRGDAGLFDKLVDGLGIKTAYKQASSNVIKVEDFV